jgi:hypothetical protein
VVAITAVRAALAAQITAVSGVRGDAAVPGQVTPPVVVIRPGRGTFIDYKITTDGCVDLTFEAVLLAATGSDRAGQQVMDAMLSADQPTSIYAAVEHDPTLSGLVAYAFVEHGEGYGLIEWGGVEYLGARLIIKAAAP